MFDLYEILQLSQTVLYIYHYILIKYLKYSRELKSDVFYVSKHNMRRIRGTLLRFQRIQI